ncbi:pullulanase-type alpha-1,6-glucosidase [Micromonospora sp. DT81.3]|uniref:pullulanase-type alpha-1,6-glucosidase n=1 Tax=Micromonospora sp. DT81.3 TaxID=3416523 RepID=UPI003CFB7D8E
MSSISYLIKAKVAGGALATLLIAGTLAPTAELALAPREAAAATSAAVTVGTVPDSRALWIDGDTILWPVDGSADGDVWTLHSSEPAREREGSGTTVLLEVDPSGLTADQRASYGWLGEVWVLRPQGLTDDAVRELLRSPLAVTRTRADGASQTTGVQLAGVIDDVHRHAVDTSHGVIWNDGAPTLRLWAPTAQKVRLLRFDDPEDPSPVETLDARGVAGGSWQVDGLSEWKGDGYLYEVTVYAPSTGRVERNLVTDPYSVALTPNSTRSVLVDLHDPRLAPEAWVSTPAPVIRNASARSIYELHVRDFSIADETIPARMRGSYLAFTADGAGRRHLRDLAAAGLNTVHLLPTFDIASIQEERSLQRTPDCDVDAGPDWAEQQACVMSVADQDGFNWGYDPLHFLAPEGSYAADANGGARVREFREMVGALHGDGLQVVLDVVFNHTAGAGQSPNSVLDRIVPGYYQRLDADGRVETSTCCANMATENRMAQKLMVDTLVLWAREYKVDGFRFDLMGFSSKQNLQAVRAALDELTLEKDGVDGSAIYLYGEGWSFGEVAGNARFEQAIQGQLGGTGIGTFNDRLRDAVHGGTPGDHASTFAQGFATGLSTDPNGNDVNGSEADSAARLAHYTDLVKIGLAGNLRSFRFVTADGTVKRGDEIPFGGAAAGYGDEPDETVNYVDAHDNETLYDILAMKLPVGTSMGDRVRMNTLALATATLSQSPALWHAGTDLLRSKSIDRNSYNSGDWFNAIDWSGRESNFGVGLPPQQDNGFRWDAIAPLLRDPSLRPDTEAIAAATAQAQQLLRLKHSTPLFSLGSAALINQKLTFPSGGPDAPPGVIVMSIDDTQGEDIDPALDGVIAVLNASPHPTAVPVSSMPGRGFELSEVQAESADPLIRDAAWDADAGTALVPARSVVVFVDPQQEAPTPPEPAAEDVPVWALAGIGLATAIALVVFVSRRHARSGRS